MFYVSGFTCNGSCVACCVSPVICQLLQTLTATATHPPLVNPPTMHSRLVCKEPKKHHLFEMPKIIEKEKWQNFQKYANISHLLFNQKSPVHRGFQTWTDRRTDIVNSRLNWPRGQFSENLIMGIRDPPIKAIHLSVGIG